MKLTAVLTDLVLLGILTWLIVTWVMEPSINHLPTWLVVHGVLYSATLGFAFSVLIHRLAWHERLRG